MEALLTNQILAQHVIDDSTDLGDRGETDSQSVSVSNDLESQVSSLPLLLPPQDDDSSCDSSLSSLNPIQAHHVHNNNLSDPCICPNGFLLRGDIPKVNGNQIIMFLLQFPVSLISLNVPWRLHLHKQS